MASGTDAPVEPVDPIANFYAAVTRKTLKGLPETGFEPAQKLTPYGGATRHDPGRRLRRV